MQYINIAFAKEKTY